MKIKIEVFADPIDGLEKIVKLFNSIKNIPKESRKKLEITISEAFTLLDTVLTLVINRLSDTLLIQDRHEFIRAIASLDNIEEWTRIEREMRLCRNLRATSKEMNSFVMKYSIKSTDDRSKVKLLIDHIFEREYQLADFIGKSLSHLAKRSSEHSLSPNGLKKIQLNIKSTINAIRKERRRLIASESDFLKLLYK